MATPELKTKHKAEQAGDIYWLDPRDITLQDEDLRGRKFPPSKSDVKELAESIARTKQEQPITCRLDAEGNPILVFGRTRLDAITLINEELDPKNPRKIAVRIVDQDEKSSFLSANEENKRRKATTPVDEAFNHQVMRERFSMKDADIAKDCGVSAAWVSKLKKVIGLPKDVLKQVHEDNLTVSDAVSMADLEPEEQKKIAADAKETAATVAAAVPAGAKPGKRPAKVVGDATKTAVRAAKAKKAKASGEDVGSVTSRSVREIRAFYDGLAEQFPDTEVVVDFCKSMSKYCSGKISDKQMENAVFNLATSKLKEKPQKASGVNFGF